MKTAIWKFLSKIGDFVCEPAMLGMLTLLCTGIGFGAGYWFGIGARADARLEECQKQTKELKDGSDNYDIVDAWSDGFLDGEKNCEHDAVTCGQITRQWHKGFDAGRKMAEAHNRTCDECTEAASDAKKELEDCYDTANAYIQARLITDSRLDHCAELFCKEQHLCVGQGMAKCNEIRGDCEHEVRNWDPPESEGVTQ